METTQRSSRTQSQDDMPLSPDSAFKLPPSKEKISARVSSETKSKLQTIIEIWQVQARVTKHAECVAKKIDPLETKKIVDEAVAAIDLTYVIDRLLAKQADIELTPWGGNAETPEKLAALLKIVEQQAKK